MTSLSRPPEQEMCPLMAPDDNTLYMTIYQTQLGRLINNILDSFSNRSKTTFGNLNHAIIPRH
jgi:hypothetical protein